MYGALQAVKRRTNRRLAERSANVVARSSVLFQGRDERPKICTKKPSLTRRGEWVIKGPVPSTAFLAIAIPFTCPFSRSLSVSMNARCFLSASVYINRQRAGMEGPHIPDIPKVSAAPAAAAATACGSDPRLARSPAQTSRMRHCYLVWYVSNGTRFDIGDTHRSVIAAVYSSTLLEICS